MRWRVFAPFFWGGGVGLIFNFNCFIYHPAKYKGYGTSLSNTLIISSSSDEGLARNIPSRIACSSIDRVREVQHYNSYRLSRPSSVNSAGSASAANYWTACPSSCNDSSGPCHPWRGSIGLLSASCPGPTVSPVDQPTRCIKLLDFHHQSDSPNTFTAVPCRLTSRKTLAWMYDQLHLFANRNASKCKNCSPAINVTRWKWNNSARCT